MKILVELTLPPLGPFSPEFHFAPLVAMLEGMIEVNRHHIRHMIMRWQRGLSARPPTLYHSGVVYKEDPPREENWKDIFGVLKDGHGDCDRVTIWRCAELREAGIHAEPVIKWQHIPQAVAIGLGYPAADIPAEGLWLVHCLVRWPTPFTGVVGHTSNGKPVTVENGIEDPSKILGMGGEYTNTR